MLSRCNLNRVTTLPTLPTNWRAQFAACFFCWQCWLSVFNSQHCQQTDGRAAMRAPGACRLAWAHAGADLRWHSQHCQHIMLSRQPLACLSVCRQLGAGRDSMGGRAGRTGQLQRMARTKFFYFLQQHAKHFVAASKQATLAPLH